jgi:hypothetical protein
MKEFTFTPDGVSALGQWLSSMSDADLAAKTAALQNNFQDWVKAHFILSIEQQIYLQQIDPEVVNFMAANSSFAFRNRLPVILIKPESKAAGDSKMTKPSSNLSAEILPDGSCQASGELVVEISY